MAAESTLSGEMKARLDRARRLIEECCEEPLDVERVSSEAGYSPCHFIRLFRQAFDITPHQYLTERRIERA
jgi:AraC-like DNA-binding protein